MTPGPSTSWLRRVTQRALGALALVLLACPAAWAGALDGAELRWRGLLDVAVAERGRAFELNRLTRFDSPFDGYGARLFLDARAGDRVQVFTQLVLRDASGIYVDGAYLTFTPDADRDLHLLLGKLPWAIGSYAPRTYSNRNPLMGAPLMYQYHTTLSWYALPGSADALLAEAGRGQRGVGYAFGGFGMPLVDDSYWDVGVTITGSKRPLEYAFGMTTGTPGWGATSEDDNSGKTVLGRVGLAPLPGLRIGASAAYGAYLVDGLNPYLPAGKKATDFHQRLGMADLELLTGHVELRGEAAWNVWETPTVGDLEVASGYGEIKYAFAFGGYVAGRLDAMRFGKIRASSGAERPWDANVTRFEAGVGYRFDRGTLAKLVHQWNQVEYEGATTRRERPKMAAAQLSVAF